MPIRLVALHCQLNAKRLFFTSIRHSPGFGIAAKVVGGDGDADAGAILLDRLEDGLGRHLAAGDAVALVDGAEQPAAGDAGRRHPLVDRELGPRGHGDGADALAFPGQVDDRPAGVAQLHAIERERREFLAAQAAAGPSAPTAAPAIATPGPAPTAASAWPRRPRSISIISDRAVT